MSDRPPSSTWASEDLVVAESVIHGDGLFTSTGLKAGVVVVRLRQVRGGTLQAVQSLCDFDQRSDGITTKRWRHTPEQLVRRVADGHRRLSGKRMMRSADISRSPGPLVGSPSGQALDHLAI